MPQQAPGGLAKAACAVLNIPPQPLQLLELRSPRQIVGVTATAGSLQMQQAQPSSPRLHISAFGQWSGQPPGSAHTTSRPPGVLAAQAILTPESLESWMCHLDPSSLPPSALLASSIFSECIAVALATELWPYSGPPPSSLLFPPPPFAFSFPSFHPPQPVQTMPRAGRLPSKPVRAGDPDKVPGLSGLLITASTFCLTEGLGTASSGTKGLSWEDSQSGISGHPSL